MSNDITRDAFEAECLRYWGKDRCSDFDLIDGKYLSARAALAWSFWQAATQAGTLAAQRQPLTVEQLFANVDLMALNAEHGMLMPDIVKIVRVIEAAQGITATPQGKI